MQRHRACFRITLYGDFFHEKNVLNAITVKEIREIRCRLPVRDAESLKLKYQEELQLISDPLRKKKFLKKHLCQFLELLLEETNQHC